jgi:hypothetical protein
MEERTDGPDTCLEQSDLRLHPWTPGASTCAPLSSIEWGAPVSQKHIARRCIFLPIGSVVQKRRVQTQGWSQISHNHAPPPPS